MFSTGVVCFCDIPVGDLAFHARKYSKFGIAFTKAFLLNQGANPVFYIAEAELREPPATIEPWLPADRVANYSKRHCDDSLRCSTNSNSAALRDLTTQ